MAGNRGDRPYIRLIMTVLAGVSLMAAKGDPLKPFQWKARLLVVSAASDSDSGFQAQDRILAQDHAGQRDRELEVIRIVGDSAPKPLDASTLRERLSLPPDRFEVALVGKDGTVVLRRHQPIALDELFGRIDAMPMRRAEMRRRGEAPSNLSK